MGPNETLSAIAVLINKAETLAAECGLALAEGEALSTDAFEAHFEKAKVHNDGVMLKQCQATVVKLKSRLAALHSSLNETAASADFPRPRTGK